MGKEGMTDFEEILSESLASETALGLDLLNLLDRPSSNEYQPMYYGQERIRFLLSDNDVVLNVERSISSALWAGKGADIVVEERRVWIHLTWEEVISEIDRINELRILRAKLFSRPEDFYLPEARIAFRFNSNKKAIAELSGSSYYPLSIKAIRNQVIQSEDEEAWQNLIRRESQRRALDVWSYQSEIR